MIGGNVEEGSNGISELQENDAMNNGGVSDDEAASPVREVIVPSRNGTEKRGFNGSKEGNDPERKRRRF